MSQSEAWYITLIGMATVFVSLSLTMVLARLYGRLARRLKAADGIRASEAVPVDVGPAARPDLPPTEPVPADVLAVIAAVIEVETQLYLSRSDARLTIRRAVPQP